MRRNAFSLIELMVGIIILAFIFAGAYRILSTGTVGSKEAMQNHFINDDVQKIVDNLTNDIHESSAISKRFPPSISPGDEWNLKTEGPENKLILTQVQFDFRKDPTTLTGSQKFYSKSEITYRMEKESDQTFSLTREILPFDSSGKPVMFQKTRKTLVKGLDELVFFRYKEPGGNGEREQIPSAKGVFFRITMTRHDKNSPGETKYTAHLTSSVQIRGSEPEGF